MSLLLEVAASVRAASAALPTGPVAVAVERLRAATDLLIWVRQASADPLGVPRLADATEHAEHALHALHRAQDELDRYLAQLGLTGTSPGPGPGPGDGRPPDAPEQPPPSATEEPSVVLAGWWRDRVAALTAQQETRAAADDGADDVVELLRRIAAGVRAGDRARLGRDLHAVSPATGLDLSAVGPAVLRRLGRDLLDHEPGPADLGRLRDISVGRVRELLPGVALPTVEGALARMCRTAPPDDAGPAHPADAAITAGVLTGVLAARLGRDPESLAADPEAGHAAGPDTPPPPGRAADG